MDYENLRVCYSAIIMASRSVNKVILIGHLGKDAETKFTPSGTSVTKMTVATNRRWKDQQTGDWKEETDWHNVTAWRIDNFAQYLQKGKQVYVEGRLQTRGYEDKDGQKKFYTEVVVDEIFLLGGRGGDSGGPSASDDMDPGYGGGPARSSSGPVSMPRSAQQRSAPPPQESRSSSPSSTPFEPEITDDDVPF